MAYGGQSVMMDGTQMMLPRCVINWDSLTSLMVEPSLVAVTILNGHCNNCTGIPISKAYFGKGQGPIHLSRAHCSSTDTHVMECADDTGVNGCYHREDAGVICQGLNLILVYIL